jgi:hypothetical protein
VRFGSAGVLPNKSTAELSPDIVTADRAELEGTPKHGSGVQEGGGLPSANMPLDLKRHVKLDRDRCSKQPPALYHSGLLFQRASTAVPERLLR